MSKTAQALTRCYCGNVRAKGEKIRCWGCFHDLRQVIAEQRETIRLLEAAIAKAAGE